MKSPNTRVNKLTSSDDSSCQASVVLWDRSFRERTHALDAYLNQQIDPSCYEVIWVGFHDQVNDEIKQYQDQYENFKVLCLNKHGDWHYGMCVNAGAKIAKGELLLISEGTVVVPTDFVGTELQVHRDIPGQLVNYHCRYDEVNSPPQYCVDLDYLKKVCILNFSENYAAFFSIKKKDFIALNGCEEDMLFHNPFPCASDFCFRAENAAYLIRWHDAIDLFHPYPVGTSPRYGCSPEYTMIQKRKFNLDHLPSKGFDRSRNKLEHDMIPPIQGEKYAPTILRSCKNFLKTVHLRIVRYHLGR